MGRENIQKQNKRIITHKTTTNLSRDKRYDETIWRNIYSLYNEINFKAERSLI